MASEESERTDIVLDQSHAHFMQTGLKVSSTIRLHRLVTISSLFIQRRIGAITGRYTKFSRSTDEETF